jgi:hypothetical protein
MAICTAPERVDLFARPPRSAIATGVLSACRYNWTCRCRSRIVINHTSTEEVLRRFPEPEEYTARSFQAACQRLSITQSMGRPGSALDNAVIESWHSTLEFELRRLEHFATRQAARAKVAAWIEDYNTTRKH